METSKNLTVCSCGLKFGVEQLSAHDVLNSKELERKCELVNQAIHFHGACDLTENCTIKKKISELKDKISKYYFDLQNRLIAIPNQITLPVKPTVLNPNETNKKKINRYDQENDKYYEDVLHLAIINVLKELESDEFVMEGFHSGACLQAKLELGKQLRKDIQCKCKPNLKCTCGKPKYPELNENEKDVLDILEVKELSDTDLARCKELLCAWKTQEKDDKTSPNISVKRDMDDIVQFFNKAKKNVGKQLMQVPENESSNFFRYHWYLSQAQDISMEWDSLIIIPQVKMIINIEVKSGPGFNALKKAASQTNIHQKIFKKIFGAHLSQEWKFVKGAFTPNLGDSQLCEYCKQFVITNIQKIGDWIKNLKHSHNIFTDEDYKAEYDNLLIGIIGYSSLRQANTLNRKIRDPQESIQATKSKVTASDTFNDSIIKEDIEKDKDHYQSEYICYMLTPDQLMAVKDPSSHIIIDGEYGCGKTYVLKERTKQCAEKYPDKDIAYMNLTALGFTSGVKSDLMDMIAKNNFKEYDNVDVVTAKDLQEHFNKHKDELEDGNSVYLCNGEDCSLVIKHFLKNSPYHYIFIDEMPPLLKANLEYDFFSLEKMYCVTMKYIYYENKNKEWIIQMEERYNAKRIHLKHNLRNSETILNLADYFREISSEYSSDNLNKASIKPSKKTKDSVCYHYHNIHHLDEDMLARAAILKYFKDKPCEPVLVLSNRYSNPCSIYLKLQKYFSAERNIVYLPRTKHADYEKNIRELKDYLEKPKGILVTDMYSFHGAQAKNIIIITDHNRSMILRNMIMRTMSFAIIIHDEDIFNQSVPGLVRDDNLHEYIHPVNTKQLFCKNVYDDKHRSICNWSNIWDGWDNSASDSSS